MNSFLFHPFIDDNDEKVAGPNHLRAYCTYSLSPSSSFFLFVSTRSFFLFLRRISDIHTAVTSKPIIIFTLRVLFILVLWLFFLLISIDECLFVSWCAHISVRDHLVVNKKTKAIKVARKHRARARARKREGEITKEEIVHRYWVLFVSSVNHLVRFGSSIFLITRLVAISSSMLLLYEWWWWMAFVCALVHTTD